MKKLAFTIVSIFIISISVKAQNASEELEIFQSLFGMEKKEAVHDFVTPAAATSDIFWEIYDSYEVERKNLGIERIKLLNSYVENYGEATDEQTDLLMKQILKLSKANNKIITKYYKKLKKKVNSVEAAEFYQIESYVLGQLRVHILENIAFFNKLK